MDPSRILFRDLFWNSFSESSRILAWFFPRVLSGILLGIPPWIPSLISSEVRSLSSTKISSLSFPGNYSCRYSSWDYVWGSSTDYRFYLDCSHGFLPRFIHLILQRFLPDRFRYLSRDSQGDYSNILLGFLMRLLR